MFSFAPISLPQMEFCGTYINVLNNLVHRYQLWCSQPVSKCGIELAIYSLSQIRVLTVIGHKYIEYCLVFST